MSNVMLKILLSNVSDLRPNFTYVVSADYQTNEIIFQVGFKKQIRFHLLGLSYLNQTTRSAGKAAAGAIIGGALTGGVGLLLGGALGGKRRNDSNATLILYHEPSDKEFEIVVKCDPNLYKKLCELPMSRFENDSVQETDQKEQFSIADEIFKLKELLDLGALTQEEFEAKKTKLLNL